MITNSLSKQRLLKLLNNFESELIERTVSTNDTDKYGQVICAFSNDLHNYAQNGILLIGVKDNGELSGFKATDKFLQNLGGLRSDGNILPQPILSVKAFSFEKGDVVVIEIMPSPFPPVRYKGKTWIRVGPRKAVASEMEERVLIERRSANVSMFDMRPCMESSLKDLDLDLFLNFYLPKAIDKSLLKKDKREIKEQLAALRFYNTKYDRPTNAGILLFGKNSEYFIPGSYIQYVKFNGQSVSDDVLNEKKFSGSLIEILEKVESFIDDAVIEQRPVPTSTLREKIKKNYPNWALRELMMNAVMHRDYESNAPIKFYQFDDHILISNAGGLYGKARPENFPDENDYRNPTLAEAMKVLGYVNRFNRGIARVREELAENGNADAVFDFKKMTSFSVIVKKCETSEEREQIAPYILGKTLEEFGISSEEIRNKFGKTSVDILEILLSEPQSTATEIAGMIKLTARTVEKNISKLKAAGIIKRIGSNKTGSWLILKH